MTQITREEVLHLAQLSNLELADQEIEKLRTDISNILEYVGQLDELNTDGVEPKYQVTGLSNVWREDEIIDYGIDREKLLELSIEPTDNQVKVPKVL